MQALKTYITQINVTKKYVQFSSLVRIDDSYFVFFQ